MDPTIMSIFIALSALSMAQAWCPSPEALPVKHPIYENRFFCARLWTDSHRSPSLSCRGAWKDIYNGEDSEFIGYRYHDKVSSLVVRPGCTLMAFQHYYYGGSTRAYTGRHHTLGSYWDNMLSSYSCYCQFSNSAITCNARDEWSVMNVCDNTTPGMMECQHEVSKGTELGYSVTEGRSVSTTVSAAMSATIKGVFETSLEVSATTGYDWSKTNSKTFSEVTTTTVKCHVEPMKTIKMMQLIGRCGDTIVYTGQYECRKG